MEKEETKTDPQESMRQINTAISENIAHWAGVMLEADAAELGYRLNYSPRDLMNALYIFHHVAFNIGFKAGIIDKWNAEKTGERLRQLVNDMAGLDPHRVLEDMVAERLKKMEAKS